MLWAAHGNGVWGVSEHIGGRRLSHHIWLNYGLNELLVLCIWPLDAPAEGRLSVSSGSSWST